MTEDIWARKPVKNHFIGVSGTASWGYYSDTEMDAWLDELKEYYETRDYIDQKITEPFINELGDCKEKLEAIKTRIKEAGKILDESYPWYSLKPLRKYISHLEELEKILEASD